MSMPLRVGLVLAGFAPYGGGGGIAGYVMELARALMKRGHFVQVFSLVDLDNYEAPKNYVYDSISVQVISMQMGSRFRADHAVKVNARRVADAIDKYQNEKRLDVLEVPEIGAHGLYLDDLKIPVVIRLHTGTLELASLRHASFDPRIRLIHSLEARAIKNANIISSLTRYQMNLARKVYNVDTAKISVIPNFVSVDNEDSKLDKVGVNDIDRSVEFGFFGTVKRIKGVDLLCEAFISALQRFPNMNLKMIGPDGAYKYRFSNQSGVEYCKKIKKADIKNIEFIGQVAREEAINLMGQCDVVVLASRYEAFPMVILEAMSMGKPVIVTRVCGLPEIVDHGETGLVIEPENSEALCSALLELAADKGKRKEMGINAYNKFIRCYSEHKVIPKIEASYLRASGKLE